jgi:ribosomal protein S18 acetylase RimI-like enzyme
MQNENDNQAWSIRLAKLDDLPTLVKFNRAIAWETERKKLDEQIVTRGVRRGLEQGAEVAYYVAEAGEEVIGSLMLTREWSDWRDGWLVWVQSVYVSPNYRGRGVFRSLMERVAQQLQLDTDVVGIRLYVEAENHRAQAVYRKTGFDDPNYKVLERIFKNGSNPEN